MDEADVPLKLLHASILDIYKVIESLVCCLKGTWVHPSTITPARLAPDLGTQGQSDWIVVIDCAAAVDAAATILSSLLMAAVLPLLTVTVAMAVVDAGNSCVNNGSSEGQGLRGRGRTMTTSHKLLKIPPARPPGDKIPRIAEPKARKR